VVREGACERVRVIVEKAVYARKFKLFMDIYSRNELHGCADWLVNAINFSNDDINTEFKPEDFEKRSLFS
jgi:hypothetical protein